MHYKKPGEVVPHPDLSKLQMLKTFLTTGSRGSHTVDTIVLHWTGGASAMSSIDYLRTEGLSYHVILGRDESEGAYKCAAYSSRAFHVGTDGHLSNGQARASIAPQGAGLVNSTAVGISFANIGDGNHDLTDWQLAWLRPLVTALRSQFPQLKYLTTHHECAPHARPDELLEFPLEVWAKELGLTAWRRQA